MNPPKSIGLYGLDAADASIVATACGGSRGAGWACSAVAKLASNTANTMAQRRFIEPFVRDAIVVLSGTLRLIPYHPRRRSINGSPATSAIPQSGALPAGRAA